MVLDNCYKTIKNYRVIHGEFYVFIDLLNEI